MLTVVLTGETMKGHQSWFWTVTLRARLQHAAAGVAGDPGPDPTADPALTLALAPITKERGKRLI